MCIKLMIKTNLYYDARSEKHQTEKCLTLIELLVSDKCVLSYATLIRCHMPIWIVYTWDICILLPADCHRSVRKCHLNWHTRCEKSSTRSTVELLLVRLLSSRICQSISSPEDLSFLGCYRHFGGAMCLRFQGQADQEVCFVLYSCWNARHGIVLQEVWIVLFAF
jgi:hypothetical protein